MMNKKRLLLIAAAILFYNAYGQVAKWLVSPSYDNIYMVNEGNLIITDSLDKKIIWSLSGKRLASTGDDLYPFAEGMAVTTKPRTDVITGFMNADGDFISLDGCRMTKFKPCFSNHHLLIAENNYYRYVNSEGVKSPNRYIYAYPFANGYASCNTFVNFQKMKDPINILITEGYEQVNFSYGDRLFRNEDIDFISSVNDENIGIVVAKHKLYYFNGNDRSLTPMFATKNESNLKNQAKLEDELALCLRKESDSTMVLKAKCGKKDGIEIRFDFQLMPVSITLTDGEYTYKKWVKPKHVIDTPLILTTSNGKCGINWEAEEILPPQFDDVMMCFNDKAFVRMSGRCGMLQVLRNEKMKVSINKGNDIDFWHQKRETVIRLDLPSIISAYSARIEIKPESGCDVDMPSEEKKDTEHGNYIQYDCTLIIPDDLPDEMLNDERNEITYPVQVVYNNLLSPIIPCKVKAWHYKYFNVDVDKSETSIDRGDLLFTFDIKAERDPYGVVIPLSVELLTESLTYEIEGLSASRYKCKVHGLREGVNNIVVQILEEGCPPAPFSFEVIYTKPSEKTKNKSAVKENIEIKKVSKPTPKPKEIELL